MAPEPGWSQFLANLGLTLFQCDQPTTRWMLHVHAWEVGLSVAAVAVVLASGGVSLRIFVSTSRIDDVAARRASRRGGRATAGAMNFLSMVGLLVNLLALAIVVMTAIGAPLLPVCQQS